MGSIFSREGSKDYRSRGGEEEKRVNQDSVFTAPYGGRKDDDKNGNRRLRIRSVEEKEKEKEKKGTMISISIFIFILAREVIWKVMERERGKIEWKEEETGNGKDGTSFSSLCDELQLLIMSKVPLQSLVQLRGVSKSWRSWIYKEGSFIGKCPLRSDGLIFPQQNGFKYIPLPNNQDEDIYTTIPVPPTTCSFPFPTIGIMKFKGFHHAFNGLLLLSTVEDETIQLLVHNPLTRQSILLPMELREFSYGPTWIGYEPSRSPYFNVVHAFFIPGSSDPLVLQIFSSRSWTWRDLVTVMRPTHSLRRCIGRAVTNDGRMFIDITFLCSVILVLDLRTTGKEYYIIVPLPTGLPPRLEDARSALGMCEGNIMYAYTQGGVLLVYKLLSPEQGGGGGGDYRWTLVIEDTSLQDRLVSKPGMVPTIRVEPHDFLLHLPVLLISSHCDVWPSRFCKIFSYNLTNGSILPLCGSKDWIFRITPLCICPLEICSGELSSKNEKENTGGKRNLLWQFLPWQKKRNELKISEEKEKKR